MSNFAMPSDFAYRPIINQEFFPMCSTVAMTVTFPTPGVNCQTNSSLGPGWSNDYSRSTSFPNGINYGSFQSQNQMYATPPSWSNTFQPSVPWTSQMTPNSSGIMTFEAPLDASNSGQPAYLPLSGDGSNAITNKLDDFEMRPRLLGKRKSAEPAPNAPSFKVRINEERMSACMHGLNLDNNNVVGARPDLEEESWFSRDLPSQSCETSRPMPSTGNNSAALSNIKLNGESKLELCRELELGLMAKQLLPKLILDELNKPCMQLVLWRPPGYSIVDVVKDRYRLQKDPEDPGDLSVTTEADMNVDLQSADRQCTSQEFSQPDSCMSEWEVPSKEFGSVETDNIPDPLDEDMDL